MNYSRLLIYKLEDRLIRSLVKLPKTNRFNSFPYLSSDTYAFLCDISIDSHDHFEALDQVAESQIVYVNGSVLSYLEEEFLFRLARRSRSFTGLVIGDSDQPPSLSFLRAVQQYCRFVACVNVSDELSGVLALPLGLESQKYRSAGQLRDFKKMPKFDSGSRSIGMLIAWNDETNLLKRSLARSELSKSKSSLELKNRVPARYIHWLMRRTLLVPCPPGNGPDSHRFWETLYLGAIPVILESDRIPAFDFAPYFSIRDWAELVELSMPEIRELYSSKALEVASFRKNSLACLAEIPFSKLEA